MIAALLGMISKCHHDMLSRTLHQVNNCSKGVSNIQNKSTECVMQASYGKDDEDAVAAVKSVYRELDLSAVFAEYEQDSYEKLMRVISQQTVVPAKVFTGLLEKIYKRKK